MISRQHQEQGRLGAAKAGANRWRPVPALKLPVMSVIEYMRNRPSERCPQCDLASFHWPGCPNEEDTDATTT